MASHVSTLKFVIAMLTLVPPIAAIPPFLAADMVLVKVRGLIVIWDVPEWANENTPPS